MRTFELFVDGAWRPAEGGRTVETINPATEQPWARVAAASVSDARAAVAAAKRAFENGWGTTTRAERADLLDKIAELIWEKQDELIELEMLDNGSTLRKAGTADLPTTAQTFEHFANLLREEPGEVEFTEEIPVTSRNIVVEEPYGVVVGIVPWNFPLASASWKIAPAIAAGNTIVLKPSPVTPVTALVLAEICSEAGLPPGVVNVVTAPENELGQALVEHPDVRKISFTGSTTVGKHIMRTAADTLKALTLELGGKSPNIILDDADLKCAAFGALFGTFFHQGQICTSGTRVLVPKALHDDFVGLMLEGVARIRIGDPFDEDSTNGPLVSQAHWKNVSGYVDVALGEGARPVCGAKRPEGLDTGYYYEPTIFTGVDNSMRIAREEVFGPVVCVIPYEDEADAIRIANDTDFGLASAVWSKDTDRALAVGRRIQAGTVWINDYHLLNLRFPFGGYKGSGFGRELGKWGYDEYTQVKHIHVGEPTDVDEKFYFEMLLGDD